MWLILCMYPFSLHREHQIQTSAAEGTEGRQVQREETSQTSQESPQSCPCVWPKCKTRYNNPLLCVRANPPSDLFLISGSRKAKHVEQSGRISWRVREHSPKPRTSEAWPSLWLWGFSQLACCYNVCALSISQLYSILIIYLHLYIDYRIYNLVWFYPPHMLLVFWWIYTQWVYKQFHNLLTMFTYYEFNPNASNRQQRSVLGLHYLVCSFHVLSSPIPGLCVFQYMN